MRETGATPRTRTAPRASATTDRDAALDDVSDHLGEVLRHADALLAEWARFAAQARAQVDAQVADLGDAVGIAIHGAVDGAAARTAAAVDAAAGRAIEARIGAQLAALSAEIARLEQRARAASRLVAEERTRDRRVTWGLVGGVALANVLLAIVLLRGPAVTVVPAPGPAPIDEPTAIEPAADEAIEVLEPAPDPGTGSAAGSPAGALAPGAAAGSAAPPFVDDPAAAAAPAPAPDSGSAQPAVPVKPVRAGTVPRSRSRKK